MADQRPPRVTYASYLDLDRILSAQHPVSGAHDVFLCGDDGDAKARVVGLLESWGWPAESVIDLGDLSSARGMEAYLLFWIGLRGALGTSRFNVRVVR